MVIDFELLQGLREAAIASKRKLQVDESRGHYLSSEHERLIWAALELLGEPLTPDHQAQQSATVQ